MKACPLCGGSEFSDYRFRDHARKWSPWNLLRLRGSRLALSVMMALPASLRNSRFFRRLCGRALFSPCFKIRTCLSCGYGKYLPRIGRKLLEAYYQSAYHDAAYPASSAANRERFFLEDDRACGQYRFVREFLNGIERPRVLEVGANEAGFSQLVRHHRPETRIDVVEPGEERAAYYRDRDIRQVGRFFPFTPAFQYDYVHLSHCFEHVENLTEAIEALKALLVPGGLLFLEVPHCTPGYWQEDTWDPDGHIHYFSRNALEKLFAPSGFELIRMDAYGMTHPERNRWYRDPNGIDPAALQEGERSIRYSEPRNGGEYIRALFRLPVNVLTEAVA